MRKADIAKHIQRQAGSTNVPSRVANVIPVSRTSSPRVWMGGEGTRGTDSEVQNAMRSIITDVYPIVLKTTDASTLDSYVKLLISEMSAARAVSGEACKMLLAGELNIVQTRPRGITQQEKQFLLLALASIPTLALVSPDSAQYTHAIQRRDSVFRRSIKKS